jgi:hypothetical protein
MSRYFDWLFVAGLVMACTWTLAEDSLLVNGTARDLKTHEVAYYEYHSINRKHHTVRYTAADGQTIATKRIDYTHGYNTPLYNLYDLRHDLHTGNEWQGDHFSIYRYQTGNTPDRKKILPYNSIVIDAGFDHYVREHWQKLQSGEAVPFDFFVADPLIKLNMKLLAVQPFQSLIKKSNPRFCYFKAVSRNRLIGWAVPEIHLAYDCGQRLLQFYHGPSNITDKNNHSQQVIIHYQYPSVKLTLHQGETAP